MVSPYLCEIKINGGCGIRTHARFYTPDGFQDRSLKPDLGNPPCSSLTSSLSTKKFEKNDYDSKIF